MEWHAFGDVRHALSQSAALVEDIVRHQIRRLVVQTVDVTNLRGGRFMNIEDVVFLLRHNKEKLKRVVRYITYRDIGQKVQKQMGAEEDDTSSEMSCLDSVKVPLTSCSKRRKLCFDFLRSPDNHSGKLEVTDELDEVSLDRMERADSRTHSMDHTQYIEFSECRQINFHKKLSKFRDWLDCGSLIDLKPGSAVLEVFGYLAYETVGQLVELSLLVKRDADGHSDPLSSDYTSVVERPVNPTAYGITSTFVTTPAPSSPGPSPPSPPSSPPSTPNTPNAIPPSASPASTTSVLTTVEGANGGVDKVSQVVASSKSSKSKKKGKAKTFLPALATSVSANALQPWHIQEAYRRYSHLIGPMSAYSPTTRPSALQTMLCC
ncbi:transcription initiation protein SPT3 homolog isoform X2 [Corticium candelabrum]|uniref:transcription initiation protein SPT3 homolog isoform X2 n=1 Tax=Corticium candelabrum TaxID=121492 RepID=UPI002E25BF6A|nr:transcription initiation protein SPT3 homolog isoform X2 [Corticium candelabrum]